jgi:dTDP-4-dehydrorhamnose reductase
MNKNILVTGANGQMGMCLRALSKNCTDLNFFFASHDDLEITLHNDVGSFLSENNIDVIINAAAYTQVDRAEDEAGDAERVNVYGPKVLAIEAEKCGAELIHISTDYVFDGEGYKPYTEDDRTHPLTVYGITKLKGEKNALNYCSKTTVVRTSWLYSEFGSNFVKTIIRLAMDRDQISVVHDQKGCPTYAGCLAEAVVSIIRKKNKKFGEIYNFSNEGDCTWYEFAKEIVKNARLDCEVLPVSSAEYPTRAKRPFYSVLSTDKIKRDFDVNILNWKDALKNNFSYISDNI